MHSTPAIDWVSMVLSEYSEDVLKELLPDDTTDSNGIIKPMLAKDYHKVSASVFNKEYLASRKLNGVRMLLYWDSKSKEIKSASRGGGDYDYSTVHIRNYPKLINFFKEHPHIILDGELFNRYKSLQEISGAARLEVNAVDCEWLEYWIYDYYDLENKSVTAEERVYDIEDWLVQKYKFPFYNEDLENSVIVIVPHKYVTGWEGIKKLHDKYVSEGFEGVVIREINSLYKPNSRTNSWLKIKEYFDETFKVISYELGLRGSEDMVFICEMKDGRTFKASPLGDRSTKAEYVENFESKYKNQFGDCKYFEYSLDGKPCQPKFLAFKWDFDKKW